MEIINFLLWSGAILLVLFVGSAMIQGIKEAASSDGKDDDNDS